MFAAHLLATSFSLPRNKGSIKMMYLAVALPDLYVYWSLRPVASIIVIRV